MCNKNQLTDFFNINKLTVNKIKQFEIARNINQKSWILKSILPLCKNMFGNIQDKCLYL